MISKTFEASVATSSPTGPRLPCLDQTLTVSADRVEVELTVSIDNEDVIVRIPMNTWRRINAWLVANEHSGE